MFLYSALSHKAYCILFQEEIIFDLSSYLNSVRVQFPRLYFMSDSDLVAMLSISRNAPALLPFVKKLFIGIQDLTFSLPNEDGEATALDFALNCKFTKNSRNQDWFMIFEMPLL